MTKSLQRTIKDAISKTFGSLKLNLLGPNKVDRSMIFSVKNFDPNNTLAAHYLEAATINSVDPRMAADGQTISKLLDVSENYLDNMEQKAKSDITRLVADAYSNLENKAKMQQVGVPTIVDSPEGREIMRNLKQDLAKYLAKLNSAAENLVAHEINNTQNMGAFDGILNAAKNIGENDPTVFKIGVMDNNRCKYCIKLWTIDGVTPRVYKLSELSATPGNDYKNPSPSISPTHINCRDVITYLSRGFGFDDRTGKIKYIDSKHDEITKQRK